MEKFKIKSDIDGLELGVFFTAPESTPIGIVQLNHGMSEYKERYLPFMEYLSEHGFLCVIHDHRGHGESIKSREDLGYFYESGADGLIEDTHEVMEFIKGKYPDLPFYLFGHSMGSLIVRAFVKKYDDEIDGLIVCGSPSENKMAVVARWMIHSIFIPIKGSRFRSHLIQKLAFGSFCKAFPEENNEGNWICSDPSVIEHYEKDPLCGFIFTLDGFETLFSIMNRVYDSKEWKVSNPETPIYFLSGWEDPCRISDRKFMQAAGKMKEIGYQNIDIKLYGKARHEILNERIKETVYRDILYWLKEHQK